MQDEHQSSTPATGADPQTEGKAANGGENNAPESMPSLETLLKQAELAAQEHHDAWLRAKADADNTRKRPKADIPDAHKSPI